MFIRSARAPPLPPQMWVRPEQILSDDAVRDKPRARFGGTLFSKYNKGVRGQFFLAVRETGCARALNCAASGSSLVRGSDSCTPREERH